MIHAAWLLVELLVLLLAVSFTIHLVQRRFGPERVRRWMGGAPVVAALKGIAVGFVTPFCTYSAIPMLVGLRQAGVPAAGYVAFVSAAPVLDPVLFGALVIIVGLPAASLYMAVAFLGAITLALVAQHLGVELSLDGLGSVEDPGGSCGGKPCAWAGLSTEMRGAARASLALLRSVGALLVVGVFVGLAIETLVQPQDVAAITGDGAQWSIPLAAALGTPLYVSTSLFVPIAHSLGRAGVGVGAIVALTISGAGANIPEFVVLAKLFSKAAVSLFIGYVFAIALAGGLLAQMLLG
ncbi:MAG: permease [Acidimicrobiia bacterium]|nr:permease [Acidimicrobiia bacterium]